MITNKANQNWFDQKVADGVLIPRATFCRITDSSIATARKVEEKLEVVVYPYIYSDHWYRWYVTSEGTRLFIQQKLTSSKIRSNEVKIELAYYMGEQWLRFKIEDDQMEFDFNG